MLCLYESHIFKCNKAYQLLDTKISTPLHYVTEVSIIFWGLLKPGARHA